MNDKTIMKLKKMTLILFSFFLFLACGDDTDNNNQPFVDPNQFDVVGERYDIGTITSEEAYSLELINRARSNPQKEGNFLVNSGNQNVENAISYFNVSKEAVTSAFNTYEKRMPLAFNKELMVVAKFVADMQIEYDNQGHTLNGEDFAKRFDDAGYPYRTVGENVFAYSDSVLQGHAGFNIDWGYGPNGIQSPPGHRHTIMGIDNAAEFREIGIRVENDIPSSKKNVGPKVITQDAGARRNSSDWFLTGVIYDDKNKNNMYDINEGISGVTISPDHGRFHAITDASGAYTIPFNTSDGITKVEAFGANFPLQIVPVQLKEESYKLDFNLQKTGANGDASIGFPAKTIKKKFMPISIPEKAYAPANKDSLKAEIK